MQPSKFVFEMHRGVLRVWTDATKTTEVGRLPGNDYDFFSDMQRREIQWLDWDCVLFHRTTSHEHSTRLTWRVFPQTATPRKVEFVTHAAHPGADDVQRCVLGGMRKG